MYRNVSVDRNWNSRRVLERVARRKLLNSWLVNAGEEADVIPAEDGAEDGIEFVEKQRVGHGEDADHHGTHLAENGSKIN